MSYSVYKIELKLQYAHPDDRNDNPLQDGVIENTFFGNILATDAFDAVNQIKQNMLYNAAKGHNLLSPEGTKERYEYEYYFVKETLVSATVVTNGVQVLKPIYTIS